MESGRVPSSIIEENVMVADFVAKMSSKTGAMRIVATLSAGRDSVESDTVNILSWLERMRRRRFPVPEFLTT